MSIIRSNLDVHGLHLDEAINVINKAILTCYKQQKEVLYVNHGFNKGNKIKSWCLNKAIENEYVIMVKPGENEGISNIYIKTNFNK